MSLWRRKERDRPEPERAEEDLTAARRELEATKAETPEYVALARQLREIRERNHLTDLFFANRRHQ